MSLYWLIKAQGLVSKRLPVEKLEASIIYIISTLFSQILNRHKINYSIEKKYFLNYEGIYDIFFSTIVKSLFNFLSFFYWKYFYIVVKFFYERYYNYYQQAGQVL